MIVDDKEWMLRQLRRMRQTCTEAGSNGTKMQDYAGRIRLVDKVIGFVEDKEGLTAKGIKDNPFKDKVFG